MILVVQMSINLLLLLSLSFPQLAAPALLPLHPSPPFQYSFISLHYASKRLETIPILLPLGPTFAPPPLSLSPALRF